MPPHGPPALACPRCGYDQSGEVAAWTDRCPVGGRCPECGTVFAWADLFNPSRQNLRWLVEHAPSARAMIPRTIPTLARMAAPWVFWRRVGVQHRTRPLRLGMWLALWIVFVHLLSSLPVAVLLAADFRSWDPAWAGIWEVVRNTPPDIARIDLANGITWPFYMRPTGFHGVHGDVDVEFAMPYLSALWIGLCWMLLLSILPTTRRLARLRSAHLWRALCLQTGMVIAMIETARIVITAAEYFRDETLVLVCIVLIIGTIVWSVVWWACALRIGWTIRSWLLLILGFVVVFLSMPFAVGLAMILAR